MKQRTDRKVFLLSCFEMLEFCLTGMPVKQGNKLGDLQRSFHLNIFFLNPMPFPKGYCVRGWEVSGLRE